MKIPVLGKVDGRTLRRGPREIASSSRVAKVLVAMQDKGDLSPSEFATILAGICETKSEMHNLSSDLTARGYVSRKIRLTPDGVAALGRIE